MTDDIINRNVHNSNRCFYWALGFFYAQRVGVASFTNLKFLSAVCNNSKSLLFMLFFFIIPIFNDYTSDFMFETIYIFACPYMIINQMEINNWNLYQLKVPNENPFQFRIYMSIMLCDYTNDQPTNIMRFDIECNIW